MTLTLHADTFLFVCGAFAAICSAVDFLLRKAAKERVRQSVGNAWTFLQYSSFEDLAFKATSFIKRCLDYVFLGVGLKNQKLQLILFYLIPALVTARNAWEMKHREIDGSTLNWPLVLFPIDLLEYFLFVSILLVTFRLLVRFIFENMRRESFSATRLLTRILVSTAAHVTTFAIIAMVLLVVHAAIVCALDIQVYVPPTSQEGNGGFELVRFLEFSLDIIISSIFFGLWILLLWFAFLFPLYGVVAAFLTLFLGKISRVVIQPAVTYFLERLYDDEKGAIARFGIIVGAGSKLAQEVLKHFNVL
jgi:hypothetical protein